MSGEDGKDGERSPKRNERTAVCDLPSIPLLLVYRETRPPFYYYCTVVVHIVSLLLLQSRGKMGSISLSPLALGAKDIL